MLSKTSFVVYLTCTSIVLFVEILSCQKKYSFEFGSVFRQEVFIKSLPTKYTEHKDVIQWIEKHIEKSSSWSCPWLLDEKQTKPEVIEFNIVITLATSLLIRNVVNCTASGQPEVYKAIQIFHGHNISTIQYGVVFAELPFLIHELVNLIYTQNDADPLLYESHVYDRDGREHGITRLLILGSIYRITLSWRKHNLRFVHNVTLSVYPADTYNIYSHTFYIQNINSTTNSEAKFLLPKFIPDQVHFSQKWPKFREIEKFYDVSLADTDNYRKYFSNFKNDIDGEGQECDEQTGTCDKTSVEYRQSKFQQDTLSVMSYNIWNMNSLDTFEGGYTQRMLRLKQTIVDASPDIVGLQEVRYEESKGEDLGPNQIGILSKWLPDYQYVFQPAQMQPNSLYDGRTEEGVAILSRYPIISQDYVLLFMNRSNSADTHQRILLHVEIIVPVIGKVHVLNTHLSLSHEAREQSVIQICRYVSQLEGPVIVLGDMNAEPNEPAMKYLNGQELLHGVAKRCVLRDVWLEQKGDHSGFTYNSLDENLRKRIDYMLYTGWQPCCTVHTINVIDDGNRGVDAASDHCPLMVTFTFRKVGPKM